MAIRRSCLLCLRTLPRHSFDPPLTASSTLSRYSAKTIAKPRSKSAPKSSNVRAGVNHLQGSPHGSGQPKAKAAEPTEEVNTASMIDRLAVKTRRAAPALTEPYKAYGSCEALVKECARVADYTIPQRFVKGAEIPLTAKGEELGEGKGWWYEQFGLLPTFNTWAQVTMLHMYLITARMRMFPPDHFKTWQQQLTDHFFYIAEERMVVYHNISSRMVRNRYLKDLFEQQRGLMLAYDEGLCKGDAVLAAAVWRNVCKGDEEVDLKGLAMIVSYMRSVLAKLEKLGDDAIADADIVFGDPADEASWVGVESKKLGQIIVEKPQKMPPAPVAPTKGRSRTGH